MTKTSLRAIPALILMTLSAGASAAGLQVWQQDASGLGVAYAGSAAVADGAGTVFYNPAGMTNLQGIQVSFGGAAAWPSYKFSGDGTGSSGGDAGNTLGTGNGHLSWRLGQDLALGFGISQPFALDTEYDSANWAGAAQGIRSDMRTVNYNPAPGWRGCAETRSKRFRPRMDRLPRPELLACRPR